MALVASRPEVVELRHWRFSLDEYHRLIDVGVLGKQDRVELIDGELIAMSPIGNRHVGVVNWLNMKLAGAVAGRAIVSIQGPVTLPPASEPEPDVVVFRHRDDFYRAERAETTDVLLVIEVSDSSMRFDRTVKLPLYARSALPEVWIVDLQRDAVVVATEPTGDGYAKLIEHRSGTISPAAFPDVAVDIAELLG